MRVLITGQSCLTVIPDDLAIVSLGQNQPEQETTKLLCDLLVLGLAVSPWFCGSKGISSREKRESLAAQNRNTFENVKGGS